MSKIIDNYVLVDSQFRKTENYEIYKAQHIKTKEFVMIKVIKLEQFVANNHIRDEVLNEIQIYKKFIKDSLSILKMHKMLKSANHIYIVYEYIETTLENFLETANSTLNPFILFKEIFNSYRHLHSFSVIHSDLFPYNIYITPQNTIKFGGLNQGRSLDKLSKIRIQPDYYNYYAPEMLINGIPSIKTDLYQLGLCLQNLSKGQQWATEAVKGMLEKNAQLRWDLVKTYDWINYIENQDIRNISEQVKELSNLQNNDFEELKFEKLQALQPEQQCINYEKQKQQLQLDIQKQLKFDLQIKIQSEKQQLLIDQETKQYSLIQQQYHVYQDNNQLFSNLQYDQSQQIIQDKQKQIFLINEQDRKLEFNLVDFIQILNKERNKYKLILNTIQSILTLNLVSEQCQCNLIRDLVSYCLQINISIQEKLSYNSQKLKQLLNSNTIFVEQFKNSSQYILFLKLLKQEFLEIQNFQQECRKHFQCIILILETLENKNDSLNQMQGNIYQYIGQVNEQLQYSKRKIFIIDQTETLTQIYLHINMILDLIKIDQVFDKNINKEIFSLEQQIYFLNLQKQNHSQLIELINVKMTDT